MDIELPADTLSLRSGIRAQVAELAAMEITEQRAAMAAGGWVTPHRAGTGNGDLISPCPSLEV